MKWTPFQMYVILIFITTGSIGTLLNKWADELHSLGSDGTVRSYNHPFVQSIFMFVGMMTNLAVFKILMTVYSKQQAGLEDEKALTKGSRDFNAFILLVPALCDMVATSTMMIGLNLTFASSFQMLRGSVIVFTGINTMIFLRRSLGLRKWSGIMLVILGLSIVGVSDYLSKMDEAEEIAIKNIVMGDILIVVAQVVVSVQVIWEEYFIAGLDIPAMQAVGWEGTFGFCVLTTLMVPFYFITTGHPFSNHPSGRFADVIDAYTQFSNNYQLVLSQVTYIISVAVFNYACISITKELSGTTTMVLDSIRTVIIWIFSLVFFGQKFQWLQLLGFIIVLIGLCLYNDLTFSHQRQKIKALFSKQEEGDNATTPAAT